jgi:hypothetical protein
VLKSQDTKIEVISIISNHASAPKINYVRGSKNERVSFSSLSFESRNSDLEQLHDVALLAYLLKFSKHIHDALIYYNTCRLVLVLAGACNALTSATMLRGNSPTTYYR